MAENHGGKIWAGEYDGSEGALQETHKQYVGLWRESSKDPVSLLRKVSIASDYYSAAGNRFARAKNAWRRKDFSALVRHLAWSVFYLHHAHRIINYLLDVVPIEHWSADQLDVAASVMYRVLRREKALYLAKIGHIVWESDPQRKPHTGALLKLYLMHASNNMRYWDPFVLEVTGLAEKTEKYDKVQAARIYRRLGMYFKQISDMSTAAELLSKAEQLAREAGAADQSLKIAACQ